MIQFSENSETIEITGIEFKFKQLCLESHMPVAEAIMQNIGYIGFASAEWYFVYYDDGMVGIRADHASIKVQEEMIQSILEGLHFKAVGLFKKRFSFFGAGVDYEGVGFHCIGDMSSAEDAGGAW